MKRTMPVRFSRPRMRNALTMFAFVQHKAIKAIQNFFAGSRQTQRTASSEEKQAEKVCSFCWKSNSRDELWGILQWALIFLFWRSTWFALCDLVRSCLYSVSLSSPMEAFWHPCKISLDIHSLRRRLLFAKRPQPRLAEHWSLSASV